MFNAIGKFFAAIYSLCSVVERSANSLDHLAGIAESEAASLAEQMELERTGRLAEVAREVQAKIRPITTDTTDTTDQKDAA